MEIQCPQTESAWRRENPHDSHAEGAQGQHKICG